MTPNIWKGCVKIHERCGGVCRWVEAIHRPGVGYTGECLHCHETDLSTEQMIPLEDYDVRQILPVAGTDALAGLEWDEHSDWRSNQERLCTIVDDLARNPARYAGGASA